MNTEFSDKSYREAFVEANIRNGIASQIRALRAKRHWSQEKLGTVSGKPQNVISRLEDPSYGKFTIQTLLSLAAAFDVALSIRFVSFTELLGQLNHLADEDLAAPSFEQEADELRRRRSTAVSQLNQPRFSNLVLLGGTEHSVPLVGALAARDESRSANQFEPGIPLFVQQAKASLHETHLRSHR